MNRQGSLEMDVVDAAALLKELGWTIRAVLYDRRDFGSWHIDGEATSGGVRVLWDGREGWIAVAVASGTSPEWRDVWIAREAPEQTLDRLKAELLKLREERL